MSELAHTSSGAEAPLSSSAGHELDAVVRKAAWRLVPILFLAYLINFIDRVNISFAKLQMSSTLGLDDVAFGIGAGMFFVGYFFFEVPSNMILERIGARRWVPIIMAAWGLATVSLAFASTPLEFYVIRFFIGFAEAGFFPGVVLFMTYWFPLSHRGRMMALFMSGLALSGVIGGPVCGAIMEFLDGYGQLAGWQWLMVVTGLPSLLVGVAIYLLLTDRPEQAHWLNTRERQVLQTSLGSEQRPKSSLKAGLRSFWSWNGAWIYFLLVCGGYGVSFWMPTLLKATGVSSSAEIGWLVAIPNLIGAVAMVLICRHSDRSQERRWHLVSCFLLAAVGYAVMASQLNNLPGLLLGLSLVHVGVLAGTPLSWTVPTRMLAPAATAVGIAIIASFGNLGGFVAPVVVGKSSAMTGSYLAGLLIIGGLLLLGALWSALTVPSTVRK